MSDLVDKIKDYFEVQEIESLIADDLFARFMVLLKVREEMAKELKEVNLLIREIRAELKDAGII